jgi:hypothetical protein
VILKINPLLAGALLLGILLIVFLLIRGCHNSKNLEVKLNSSQAALDSLTLRHEADSMTAKENEKNYNISLEYANGIIVLRENQRDATEEKLLATTFDYAALKKKYEQVRADPDTSATYVPNDFIKDCHECFDELEHKQHLIKLYVSHVDSLDAEIARKDRLNINRIGELTRERNAYRQNSQDAIAIAAKAQASAQPRRKGFLSLGVIGQRDYFLMGVGAGGFYMDKKSRLFGANIYGTNQGPLVTANLALPLSFKRK